MKIDILDRVEVLKELVGFQTPKHLSDESAVYFIVPNSSGVFVQQRVPRQLWEQWQDPYHLIAELVDYDDLGYSEEKLNREIAQETRRGMGKKYEFVWNGYRFKILAYSGKHEYDKPIAYVSTGIDSHIYTPHPQFRSMVKLLSYEKIEDNG